MALKAGYNGIKKNVLDKLLQMSGALIIKSLGTALSLSDAGELRVRNASDSHSGVVQPDGETTYIEEGLLKAMASGYSKDLLSGSDTYNPVASRADIDISQVIDDYDFIYVIAGWLQGTGGCVTSFINVDILKQLTDGTTAGKHWIIGVNPHADQWVRIQYDNGVLKQFGSSAVGIINVYGIKF